MWSAVLTTTASNLSPILANISRQSANAATEAYFGAMALPSSSLPPFVSVSSCRRSMSQSDTISTDLCLATSLRSLPPMPPQPTLATRNFSFFHGSLRRRLVTVRNANGVASEANTKLRRVICIPALNMKPAARESGRPVEGREILPGSAAPRREHHAEVGAVGGAALVEIGPTGLAPACKQLTEVRAVHDAVAVQIRGICVA